VFITVKSGVKFRGGFFSPLALLFSPPLHSPSLSLLSLSSLLVY